MFSRLALLAVVGRIVNAVWYAPPFQRAGLMSAPLPSTANPETVLPQPPAPDTQADTDRVNWLERAGGVVISVVPENAERNQYMVWAKAINYIGSGDSLRAAIDNAQLPAASGVANPEAVAHHQPITSQAKQ